MIELLDKQTGLRAFTLDLNNPIKQEVKEAQPFFGKINYNNPAIREFILDTTEYGPLGNFFSETCMLYGGIPYFFTTEQEITNVQNINICSFALLTQDSKLFCKDQIEEYIEACEKNHSSGEEGFMSYHEALELYENDKLNHCEISYILTNPNLYNSGIGDLTVKFILNNAKIVNPMQPQGTFFAHINKYNKPSRAVFERKNGFKALPDRESAFNWYIKPLNLSPSPNNTQNAILQNFELGG